MISVVHLINDTSQPFVEALFNQLAVEVIKSELKDEGNTEFAELEIGLTLCEGETIREMNRKYRGNDSKTDVLSFTGEYPAIPQLGDIIIDIEQASAQKGNMSLSYEVQTLFLHGLLHILGYDHMTRQQQLAMQEKEKFYQKYIKEIGR
ncbi:MAG: rRNA maturation RNase YbeY [Candidatus Stygibacter australis]|nr:rRNA maturation RNase YbeY [Candidatus Stygibacter australis]MDP8323449.1 rRNA maturation RNase YbeY [Candidatus Stygibacter australis]